VADVLLLGDRRVGTESGQYGKNMRKGQGRTNPMISAPLAAPSYEFEGQIRSPRWRGEYSTLPFGCVGGLLSRGH